MRPAVFEAAERSKIMANLTLQKPWTDTPVSGATAATLSLPIINYRVDWGKQTNSGSEAFITNATAPLNAPQRFKFARTDIANVFTNSGIEPNMMTPSKRGVSVVCQLNSIFDVVDSENAAFKQQLPMSCHVVIKVPSSDLITSEVIKDYLCRTLAGLFDTGSSDTDRLTMLIRGSLLPSEMT